MHKHIIEEKILDSLIILPLISISKHGYKVNDNLKNPKKWGWGTQNEIKRASGSPLNPPPFSQKLPKGKSPFFLFISSFAALGNPFLNKCTTFLLFRLTKPILKYLPLSSNFPAPKNAYPSNSLWFSFLLVFHPSLPTLISQPLLPSILMAFIAKPLSEGSCQAAWCSRVHARWQLHGEMLECAVLK